MRSPLITVIIPTFNRPELVQQAVASVLAQQGGYDFDVLVIDDGSSTDTAAALARFGPAIRYVRQENRGLNPARNHGLRLARGEYIALLDDDDVWLPAKTALLMPALAAHPHASFVHSNFFIWKPGSGERRADGLRSWFPRDVEWEEIYGAPIRVAAAPGADVDDVDTYLGDLYYWSLFAPMVLPSTAILRRTALAADTWFPERDSVGDWEFFARLSHRAQGAFVPVETTLNRSHDDAVRLTRTDPRVRVQRRVGLLRRLWREDTEFMHRHGTEVDAIEAGCLRRLARLAIAAGRSAEARGALRELRSLPGHFTLADRLAWGLTWMPFADAGVGLARSIRGRLRKPTRSGF